MTYTTYYKYILQMHIIIYVIAYMLYMYYVIQQLANNEHSINDRSKTKNYPLKQHSNTDE